MPMPFVKVLWGRGTPFACKACGTTIVASRLDWVVGGSLAVAGILIAKVLGPLSIIPLSALLGAYDWATMKVERAA